MSSKTVLLILIMACNLNFSHSAADVVVNEAVGYIISRHAAERCPAEQAWHAITLPIDEHRACGLCGLWVHRAPSTETGTFAEGGVSEVGRLRDVLWPHTFHHLF